MKKVRAFIWEWLWERPHHKIHHRLLSIPIVGELAFQLDALCPYCWEKSEQYDSWVSRRICPKCKEVWDLG